jgi:hypothetical protein
MPTCGRPTVCCGDRCVPTQSDPFNCGGCGVACRTGETCADGRCVAAGCGAGPACGAGQACCNGLCVDTGADPRNCGGCNVFCVDGTVCRAGTCVRDGGCGMGPACSRGSTCCGASCSNTQVDPANCGACGNLCTRGQTCVAGRCTFQMGCGGGPPCPNLATCCGSACTNVVSDPFNCGSCGNVCRAGQRCLGGMCTGGPTCGAGPACMAGSLCCNDACVDVRTDPANCGGCGVACRAGTECRGARCLPVAGCGGGPGCAPGQNCCGDACVNTQTDAQNCGACGRACVTPPNTEVACANGACGAPVCVGRTADCNRNLRDGCEANLATDTNNCGACGTACGAGLACQDGRCGMPSTGSEGAFNPRVNPTFLTPGVHNFTTINVPANVVVFVAGNGTDNGVLDLRATGDVTIDGTIDVSGGPGVQSTITSRSTRQGRAGAGGFTGDPRSATPGPACEWVAGVSGGNGRGFAGTTGTCRVGSNAMCITDNQTQLIFASPAAQFGGGGGVFTGYRAYGAGGGGFAGGGPGALGAPYPGQEDCTGTTGGGGTAAGQGGNGGGGVYNGRAGTLGQTQCPGIRPEVPAAWVGGGGGGSIGAASAADLAVNTTLQPGSGGGGGSADYLNRPAFGGTSGGGGGGGALRVWSQTQITLNGRALANGGVGGDAYIGTNGGAGCDPQPGAAGGGGSGGVVFLRAPVLTVGPRAQVSAAGGEGGVASLYATGGAGGVGGLGRIRISANPARCTLAGTFNPPLVSGCTPAPATPGRAFVAAFPN